LPQKELLVVSGPNGSGKSTFVTKFLAERHWPYLCADLIATEFTHLDVLSRQVEAGREFIRRSEKQLKADVDFVIESTMSGRTLRSFLARARSVGLASRSFSFIWIRLKRASPATSNGFAVAGTMFPRKTSVDDLRVAAPISGVCIVKLPIIGTSFIIQQAITNG
jgi:hypothetical protein